MSGRWPFRETPTRERAAAVEARERRWAAKAATESLRAELEAEEQFDDEAARITVRVVRDELRTRGEEA